jgi:hypothetical protein
MTSNPGKPITIYEVGGLVGQAFPLAFTPHNITAGFKVSGIYPFDRDIFGSDEFLSSYVTDREIPGNCSATSKKSSSTPQSDFGRAAEPAPSSSRLSAQYAPGLSESSGHAEPSVQSAQTLSLQSTTSSQCEPSLPITPRRQNNTTTIVTPTDIRPYPKAAPRKTAGGKKKGSTRILTDTPVKQALESEIQERLSSKKRKTDCKEKERTKKQLPKKKQCSRNNNAKVSVADADSCCICKAIYGSDDDVKQKEDWYKCKSCLKWAHESCGNVDPRYFECFNCWDSD